MDGGTPLVAEAIRGWAALAPWDLMETVGNRLVGFHGGAGAGHNRGSGRKLGTRMQEWPRAAPVLVGRDSELGELLAGLDEVASGSGRLLLLAGDPRIGKSRLAHTLNKITWC